MKHRFLILTALLCISALLLGACGRDRGARGEAAAAPADAPADAPAGDAAAGQELFNNTCAACHGEGGKGVPGLGKDMTTSEFIASKSNAELVEFIKQGRDPSHPDNTTNVAMPPKGGNPALSQEDLQDIVAYMRTLHE